MLKEAKTEKESEDIKTILRKNMDKLLSDIQIDVNVLKDNFVNILLDEKSSKYLWILYSKYDKEENYIDKLTDTLKQENKIVRGGTNTYKMNGWMTHTLYVYQIVNYNLANNIELINFNGEKENKNQVKELHDIYNQLSKESKFILNIFTLIHDVGVIDDIKFHDKLGSKYVEKVVREIAIKQEILNQKDILINEKDLIKILQVLVENHTLITMLSAESSDAYVENEYNELLNKLPKVEFIKKEIPKILLLLAYGDVIAVDESLMDIEKYKRICDCYDFFDQISKGEKASRDKEKVAIERICDMVGESKVSTLETQFDYILKKNNIEKIQFIEDMYNIKLMRYTGPLMKSLKDTEMTIKIYYELFELIGKIDNKEELQKYTIIFVPDKHENDFVEQFKNNNFFKCVEKMKNSNENECIYGNVKIEKNIDLNEKYLYIKVL